MTPEMLRSMMDAHHLNAKKLAGLLLVSVRSVNHWLAGSRKITARNWGHIVLTVTKPKTLTLSGSDWRVD
jgi:DNA-binding transcriptional regulator YdaS (Cro superfamily)